MEWRAVRREEDERIGVEIACVAIRRERTASWIV
jgi:hypothetical protein